MIIKMFGFFQNDTMRKLSFAIFLLCILFSLKNQNAETKRRFSPGRWSSSYFHSRQMFSSTNSEKPEDQSPRSLEYDFYHDSCPQAEEIIRAVVKRLQKLRSDVAPALLRLVFHDCFIEGCDASVLLDATDEIDSEKDSPPNETLKGFDIIDIIKSELEESCPGVVSCADILVLAAREGVVLSGGPFYPLYTGRRDSTLSFPELATYELPSPHEDLTRTIASFASRGFDERETVSLLGAHSIGKIHCQFFEDRLYSFGGTDEPDPSLDVEFLYLMRSKCNNSNTTEPASPPSYNDSMSSSPEQPRMEMDYKESGSGTSSPASSPSDNSSPPPSPEEPAMKMDYEGPGSHFGTLYYRSLLQRRGILFADQQLMAGEGTGSWVRAYASDASLFRRDFAQAMMKLSNLRVLTAPMGQVRLTCSKVA